MACVKYCKHPESYGLAKFQHSICETFMSQYRETVVEVPNVNANLAVASESFPISTYTEIESKLRHVGCKLINYIYI